MWNLTVNGLPVVADPERPGDPPLRACEAARSVMHDLWRVEGLRVAGAPDGDRSL